MDRLRVSPSVALEATRFWNSWMLAAYRSLNLVKVFCAIEEKENAGPLLSNFIINILILSSTHIQHLLQRHIHTPTNPTKKWIRRGVRFVDIVKGGVIDDYGMVGIGMVCD